MTRIKPGEWHDYVTVSPHGSQHSSVNYAAGTKCKVSRDEEDRLVLKFDDETIVLSKHTYAFGIERSEHEIAEFFLAY